MAPAEKRTNTLRDNPQNTSPTFSLLKTLQYIAPSVGKSKHLDKLLSKKQHSHNDIEALKPEIETNKHLRTPIAEMMLRSKIQDPKSLARKINEYKQAVQEQKRKKEQDKLLSKGVIEILPESKLEDDIEIIEEKINGDKSQKNILNLEPAPKSEEISPTPHEDDGIQILSEDDDVRILEPASKPEDSSHTPHEIEIINEEERHIKVEPPPPFRVDQSQAAAKDKTEDIKIISEKDDGIKIIDEDDGIKILDKDDDIRILEPTPKPEISHPHEEAETQVVSQLGFSEVVDVALPLGSLILDFGGVQRAKDFMQLLNENGFSAFLQGKEGNQVIIFRKQELQEFFKRIGPDRDKNGVFREAWKKFDSQKFFKQMKGERSVRYTMPWELSKWDTIFAGYYNIVDEETNEFKILDVKITPVGDENLKIKVSQEDYARARKELENAQVFTTDEVEDDHYHKVDGEFARLEDFIAKIKSFENVVGAATFSGKGIFGGQIEEVKASIRSILEKLDSKKTIILGGETNLGGIDPLYDVAMEMGFQTAGITVTVAKKENISDLRKVNYNYFAEGGWGAESQTFTDLVTVLIGFGGGGQAKQELIRTAKAGKKVVLMPGIKDAQGNIGAADDLEVIKIIEENRNKTKTEAPVVSRGGRSSVLADFKSFLGLKSLSFFDSPLYSEYLSKRGEAGKYWSTASGKGLIEEESRLLEGRKIDGYLAQGDSFLQGLNSADSKTRDAVVSEIVSAIDYNLKSKNLKLSFEDVENLKKCRYVKGGNSEVLENEYGVKAGVGVIRVPMELFAEYYGIAKSGEKMLFSPSVAEGKWSLTVGEVTYGIHKGEGLVNKLRHSENSGSVNGFNIQPGTREGNSILNKVSIRFAPEGTNYDSTAIHEEAHGTPYIYSIARGTWKIGDLTEPDKLFMNELFAWFVGEGSWKKVREDFPMESYLDSYVPEYFSDSQRREIKNKVSALMEILQEIENQPNANKKAYAEILFKNLNLNQAIFSSFDYLSTLQPEKFRSQKELQPYELRHLGELSYEARKAYFENKPEEKGITAYDRFKEEQEKVEKYIKALKDEPGKTNELFSIASFIYELLDFLEGKQKIDAIITVQRALLAIGKQDTPEAKKLSGEITNLLSKTEMQLRAGPQVVTDIIGKPATPKEALSESSQHYGRPARRKLQPAPTPVTGRENILKKYVEASEIDAQMKNLFLPGNGMSDGERSKKFSELLFVFTSLARECGAISSTEFELINYSNDSIYGTYENSPSFRKSKAYGQYISLISYYGEVSDDENEPELGLMSGEHSWMNAKSLHALLAELHNRLNSLEAIRTTYYLTSQGELVESNDFSDASKEVSSIKLIGVKDKYVDKTIDAIKNFSIISPDITIDNREKNFLSVDYSMKNTQLSIRVEFDGVTEDSGSILVKLSSPDENFIKDILNKGFLADSFMRKQIEQGRMNVRITETGFFLCEAPFGLLTKAVDAIAAGDRKPSLNAEQVTQKQTAAADAHVVSPGLAEVVEIKNSIFGLRDYEVLDEGEEPRVTVSVEEKKIRLSSYVLSKFLEVKNLDEGLFKNIVWAVLLHEWGHVSGTTFEKIKSDIAAMSKDELIDLVEKSNLVDLVRWKFNLPEKEFVLGNVDEETLRTILASFFGERQANKQAVENKSPDEIVEFAVYLSFAGQIVDQDVSFMLKAAPPSREFYESIFRLDSATIEKIMGGEQNIRTSLLEQAKKKGIISSEKVAPVSDVFEAEEVPEKFDMSPKTVAHREDVRGLADGVLPDLVKAATLKSGEGMVFNPEMRGIADKIAALGVVVGHRSHSDIRLMIEKGEYTILSESEPDAAGNRTVVAATDGRNIAVSDTAPMYLVYDALMHELVHIRSGSEELATFSDGLRVIELLRLAEKFSGFDLVYKIIKAIADQELGTLNKKLGKNYSLGDFTLVELKGADKFEKLSVSEIESLNKAHNAGKEYVDKLIVNPDSNNEKAGAIALGAIKQLLNNVLAENIESFIDERMPIALKDSAVAELEPYFVNRFRNRLNIASGYLDLIKEEGMDMELIANNVADNLIWAYVALSGLEKVADNKRNEPWFKDLYLAFQNISLVSKVIGVQADIELLKSKIEKGEQAVEIEKRIEATIKSFAPKKDNQVIDQLCALLNEAGTRGSDFVDEVNRRVQNALDPTGKQILTLTSMGMRARHWMEYPTKQAVLAELSYRKRAGLQSDVFLKPAAELHGIKITYSDDKEKYIKTYAGENLHPTIESYAGRKIKSDSSLSEEDKKLLSGEKFAELIHNVALAESNVGELIKRNLILDAFYDIYASVYAGAKPEQGNYSETELGNFTFVLMKHLAAKVIKNISFWNGEYYYLEGGVKTRKTEPEVKELLRKHATTDSPVVLVRVLGSGQSFNYVLSEESAGVLVPTDGDITKRVDVLSKEHVDVVEFAISDTEKTGKWAYVSRELSYRQQNKFIPLHFKTTKLGGKDLMGPPWYFTPSIPTKKFREALDAGAKELATQGIESVVVAEGEVFDGTMTQGSKVKLIVHFKKKAGFDATKVKPALIGSLDKNGVKISEADIEVIEDNEDAIKFNFKIKENEKGILINWATKPVLMPKITKAGSEEVVIWFVPNANTRAKELGEPVAGLIRGFNSGAKFVTELMDYTPNLVKESVRLRDLKSMEALNELNVLLQRDPDFFNTYLTKSYESRAEETNDVKPYFVRALSSLSGLTEEEILSFLNSYRGHNKSIMPASDESPWAEHINGLMGDGKTKEMFKALDNLVGEKKYVEALGLLDEISKRSLSEEQEKKFWEQLIFVEERLNSFHHKDIIFRISKLQRNSQNALVLEKVSIPLRKEEDEMFIGVIAYNKKVSLGDESDLDGRIKAVLGQIKERTNLLPAEKSFINGPLRGLEILEAAASVYSLDSLPEVCNMSVQDKGYEAKLRSFYLEFIDLYAGMYGLKPEEKEFLRKVVLEFSVGNQHIIHLNDKKLSGKTKALIFLKDVLLKQRSGSELDVRKEKLMSWYVVMHELTEVASRALANYNVGKGQHLSDLSKFGEGFAIKTAFAIMLVVDKNLARLSAEMRKEGLNIEDIIFTQDLLFNIDGISSEYIAQREGVDVIIEGLDGGEKVKDLPHHLSLRGESVLDIDSEYLMPFIGLGEFGRCQKGLEGLMKSAGDVFDDTVRYYPESLALKLMITLLVATDLEGPVYKESEKMLGVILERYGVDLVGHTFDILGEVCPGAGSKTV